MHKYRDKLEFMKKHIVLCHALVLGLYFAARIVILALPFYGVCEAADPAAVAHIILSFFFFLCLSGAAFWVVVLSLVQRDRDHHPFSAIAGVAVFVGLVFGANTLRLHLEEKAVEDFVERMQPVIASIEAHEEVHGTPPETPMLPPSGICPAQELQYEVHEDYWSLKLVVVESRTNVVLLYRSVGWYGSGELIGDWQREFWVD